MSYRSTINEALIWVIAPILLIIGAVTFYLAKTWDVQWETCLRLVINTIFAVGLLAVARWYDRMNTRGGSWFTPMNIWPLALLIIWTGVFPIIQAIAANELYDPIVGEPITLPFEASDLPWYASSWFNVCMWLAIPIGGYGLNIWLKNTDD